jgi:hypothetical protein
MEVVALEDWLDLVSLDGLLAYPCPPLKYP